MMVNLMANSALIGYTGFVGGNLIRQYKFDHVYNSKNLNEAQNEQFDLVICAAPSAVKWKANQYPEEDLVHINKLTAGLIRIKTSMFVQISTVDVYPDPSNVDETTPIDTTNLHPYGKHRNYLENFIQLNFEEHLIIRLPALFGVGLKKNLIFDLLHNNALHLIHKDSTFQFYNLENLWNDLNKALEQKIDLLNISSEPTTSEEIARNCFNMEFNNITDNPPVHYDMRSKYASLFGGKNGYLYSRNQVMQDLTRFIQAERERNG
jgi:nucleoside-diphosphate-sugar epimerase